MSAAGKLGDLLIARGVISADQLKSALDYQKANRLRLSQSLVQLGHVNEKVLATFLGQQYGLTAISLEDVAVPPEVTKLVPFALCEKNGLVPLIVDKNRLSIAMADPTNVSAIDDLRFLCNMDVQVFVATESAVQGLLERSYVSSTQLKDVATDDDFEEDAKTNMIEIGASKEAHEIEEDRVGDRPVIKLINQLFVEGIRRKVSDIHIEPFENFSRVRYRIDGALHEVMRLPPQLRASVPSRIKVMAELDISEKRLPQDGRIQIRAKGRQVDVRVSLLPTMFGEKVVMRLLDQGSKAPELLSIGFEEDQLKLFRAGSRQPYGMVLVTGPTGSGKSTTLYAMLSELNVSDVNISTVEDPVEYNMLGVNQVQMKEGIGLNFATALRSLLRQDPDIVMVGEIRDQETAEIAIKASLTGHMVFSTLHTNDAPSTITRLVHMGVEPFLITASLTLVQAQRLIRTLCDKCRAPDEKVKREDLLAAEVPEHWLDKFQPLRGKGCDRCGSTGYKGRKGIFEVLNMTEHLRSLVIKGANADQLKKAAVEAGMLTLRQAALLKLFRGETTLEEVLNNSRADGDLVK